MGKLLVQQKQIVVPGEVLAEGMDYLPGDGTFRDKNQIVANILGLVNLKGRLIKLIPLAGKYKPKRDDLVIGRVTDIVSKGWVVDINCAYPAMITLRDATADFIPKDADLSRYFNIGDYVIARITRVTSQNLIDLSMRGPMLKKLEGGRLIKINPTKVPRVIGKKASMINLIKEKTDCQILVGQNGLIWLNGDPKGEILAVNAILKIERESHLSGLTEEIEKFIDEGLKAI
ncbi:RNA-binding protein [Candidatus Woesearchaeota archaeon]|nr:exosome complex protein Rrp4 [Candidatus Woesearchaeota archaeon]RLE43064.1 MAG: RNA-binding protein [Candidatus Woesearchaeota archaeon]